MKNSGSVHEVRGWNKKASRVGQALLLVEAGKRVTVGQSRTVRLAHRPSHQQFIVVGDQAGALKGRARGDLLESFDVLDQGLEAAAFSVGIREGDVWRHTLAKQLFALGRGNIRVCF